MAAAVAPVARDPPNKYTNTNPTTAAIRFPRIASPLPKRRGTTAPRRANRSRRALSDPGTLTWSDHLELQACKDDRRLSEVRCQLRLPDNVNAHVSAKD